MIRIPALLLAATLAFAQSGPTGGLSGHVTDPAGAAVPSAIVTLRNRATSLTRNTRSNNEGHWETRFLPTGGYDITIEAAGFQKLVQTRIVVEAAVVAAFPAQL